MTRLRYVQPDEPGYTRKKWGQGFSYLDTDRQTLSDPDLREWIESLAIPPAWTDVWICPDKNGHILATGRDSKRRKQYLYHPEWRKTRDQKKFDELVEFGQSLPVIREITDEHLRQTTLSRERVLAAVVRLLESTLARIGNEEYARNNDSYGLSTLTDDHVEVKGSRILFDFVGKGGKEHCITLNDPRLARIIKRCHDIPGYELFQYYGEDGDHHVIDSSDVNAYLHEITGKMFTAKVFRTWGGSALMIQYLCESRQQEDADAELAIRESIEHVAHSLGNTKSITEKYYVHPAILKAYQDETLCTIYERYQKKSTDSDLTPAEHTLLDLIEA
jgi:DNA topoisomerase-1